MRQFGWRKDPWNPGAWMHKPKMRADQLPITSIIGNMPLVRSQGDTSSCVGFGIGANITHRARKLWRQSEWFSPTWIYNGARFIEGDLAEDNGCCPDDALTWLLKNGCLLEHLWPFNPNAVDKTAPGSVLGQFAADYPLVAYYRVGDGVPGIMSAIADGQPVSIGTPWFAKWQDVLQGFLPVCAKDDEILGGHETLLYGYDRRANVFYGMNSWGTEWGDAGYYVMPASMFDVFKTLGGYDAHYITFDNVPLPTPLRPKQRTCWDILFSVVKQPTGVPCLCP